MKQIDRVAIIGGTHGYEFTGAYLIQKFAQFPELITRKSFETVTLLANPEAFKASVRYVDKDLNRCFLEKDLLDPTKTSYEEIRAKFINKNFGDKGDNPADFLLDLHTTTANMGLTLILSNNHPFNLKLAAYLSCINPSIRVYRSSIESDQENLYLNSICKCGFGIEVGSIAHGILNPTVFSKMEELIYTILDCLEDFNSGKIQLNNETLTWYKYFSVVDYPKNEDGEVNAMIHPELLDKDYEALNPEEPMFFTFDGKTIAYEGESTVYPIFINSAANSEKRIAMFLTQKQMINI